MTTTGMGLDGDPIKADRSRTDKKECQNTGGAGNHMTVFNLLLSWKFIWEIAIGV